MRPLHALASTLLLFACASTQRRASRPMAAYPARHCADRGPPVAHRPSAASAAAASSRGGDDIAVADRTVVYRDEHHRVVQRSLTDGAVRSEVTAGGAILYADDRGALLWARPVGERRLVRVTFADRRVVTSDPVRLPDWLLASSESEPSDYVAGWPEGDDAVITWTGFTSWRGGTPPPPQEEGQARQEDCGSLRIDAAGRVTEGGTIAAPTAAATTPRSPVAPRAYLQQVYAGDGVWWFNDIDPVTGVASHATVDGAGTRVEVRLPTAPDGARAEVAGVWAAGDRVVVFRVMRQREGWQHPRTLVVLDRRTGAVAWSASAALLEVIPPRP